MAKHYDILVIGTGAMGAAACHAAASQGLSCLGIDQFDPPHDKGSHNGQTRIIRESYFELPDYVPLLQASYALWADLEKEGQKKLLHQSGMLYLGEPGSYLLDGVRKSAEAYDLTVPTLSPAELVERFPQFHFPKELETVYEAKAGYLDSDECIRSMLRLAQTKGATLLNNTKVISWELRNDHVVVFTGEAVFQAKKLIITAGAYAQKLIPALNRKIKVSRQHIFWFEPKDPAPFTLERFACWNVQDPDYPGLFYGFPYAEKKQDHSAWGMKIAHHYPGVTVDYPEDHSAASREEVEKETQLINSILKKYMPLADGPLLHTETCYYANSPDEHFVIDHLPNTEAQVVVAAGFSGHGFKFSPVVGKILIELAQTGKSTLPIDFLSFKRLRESSKLH